MKTVYVADDDPSIIQIINLSLQKVGDLRIMNFSNGLDLYREIMQNKPDLIITDIILPKLEGLAVARLLKFSDLHSDIPLLVVSSVIDRDIVQQVQNVGADDFLRKPFRVADIREKTKALLKMA